MPGLTIDSRSSSEGPYLSAYPNSVLDESNDYPAVSFPGYAEKPLDEQLEPIAVIGMGESGPL